MHSKGPTLPRDILKIALTSLSRLETSAQFIHADHNALELGTPKVNIHLQKFNWIFKEQKEKPIYRLPSKNRNHLHNRDTFVRAINNIFLPNNGRGKCKLGAKIEEKVPQYCGSYIR